MHYNTGDMPIIASEGDVISIYEGSPDYLILSGLLINKISDFF